jgi:phosphonoacetaldehyde hydrolase
MVVLRSALQVTKSVALRSKSSLASVGTSVGTSGGIFGIPTVIEHAPRASTYTGPLQAAILDWSGTTADPHVVAPAVVFVEVFKKHGVPISMVEARGPMGLRKDLHIEKILEIPEVKDRWMAKHGKAPTQGDVDMLFADFVPSQVECLPKYVSLLPGAAEATQYMQNTLNMKLGSTTGFTRVMVDVLEKHARKQGYNPDYTVGGDEVENNMGFRPTPFMIYKNLVQLGIWPIESVVKVDDTTSGVGEGITAGCWSVGVAGWSNYTNIDAIEDWDVLSKQDKLDLIAISRQKLYETGAHYVCDSIRELPHICEDINARLARGETPQGSREQVRMINEDMEHLANKFHLYTPQ